jgi:hypothetical protein
MQHQAVNNIPQQLASETLHFQQLNMSDPNSTSPTVERTFFHSTTELADLGRDRFDHDTAEITDRDAALFSHQPVTVRQGRAPKGLENQVFAWNTFKYTTEDRNDREELKGDLHEGQLHRQNRAARDPAGLGGQSAMGGAGSGRVRDGGRGGRVRREEQGDGKEDALCAGRQTEKNSPPLAKGYAEELNKGMFWDEPIV